jgi:hypothetical protein
VDEPSVHDKIKLYIIFTEPQKKRRFGSPKWQRYEKFLQRFDQEPQKKRPVGEFAHR